MSNVTQRRFYVYAYFRTDGTPYYIGKGTKRRIHAKAHVAFVPPIERRKILFDGLTNQEALETEIALIHCLGRKDLATGCLRNQTNGGDGAAVQSMSLRRQKSQRLKGRRRSHAFRLALSEANLRAGAKAVGVSYPIWKSLSRTQRAHAPANAAKLGLTVAEYVERRLPEWEIGCPMDVAAARHGVCPRLWKSLTCSQRGGATSEARRLGLTVAQYIQQKLPAWRLGDVLAQTAAKHSIPTDVWRDLSKSQRSNAVNCARRKGISVLDQIRLMAQDWGIDQATLISL